MASLRLPFGALLALLALLVSSAAAQPTKNELIDEVKNLRNALQNVKYLGRYAVVVAAINQALPKMNDIPDDADLSQADHKTILVPQNAALGPAGLKGALKGAADPSKLAEFSDMGLLNVLDGYFTMNTIKDQKSFPTMLGRNLKRYFVPLVMRKGAAYALGQSKNPFSWSQIVNAGIYRGKYFIAHGVDALQQP